VPSALNKFPVHYRAHARWHATRVLCALCLLLLYACAAQAMPLPDYRERVRKAADALESLRGFDDEEGANEATRRARTAETLRQVRQAVVTVETVEWNNTSVRVDNSWLDQSLSEYDKLRASDSHKADALLLRVEEQLYALDERLAETERAGRGVQGKDEEKAKLAAILRRAEYNKKEAEESALARLKRRILKWLDRQAPAGEQQQQTELSRSNNAATITQVIVICLLLAGILLLALRYGPRLFNRRIRRRKRERREARVVLGERLEEDQTSDDLLAEAEKLARVGDLRAAIRKGYIALLCELGDRKILSLAQSKTNRDYLRAVQGVEPLHTEMRRLTNVFENHWYGFAPASLNDWTNFRAGYAEALKE
jgi:hypothetical protein